MLPRNIKLILAYDGTGYAGWQVQPGRDTIQGLLATAIGRVTGENVLPQASGRTDAGVHALRQVVSFATGSPIPAKNLVVALNDALPPAIRIYEATEVAPDFHARKWATRKTYRYRIFRGDVCSPFLSRYVWHYPYPLNEVAMAEASGTIVGEHDFTSFAAVDPERDTATAMADDARGNVRTVYDSAWARDGDEFIYQVTGSGFLHHMVRNLVGTFILVGKETLRRDDLARIINARNRSEAGATAPPQGLYLVTVEY